MRPETVRPPLHPARAAVCQKEVEEFYGRIMGTPAKRIRRL